MTRRDFELFRAHFGGRAALLVTFNASEVSTIAWLVTDETTVVDDDVMPVGFARPGTEIRLLDGEGRGVRRGEVGEIALRSRYIARGYWRRPELTAERFLPDPEGGEQGMYRTGDLGRFLPDGRLVHLGRNDGQIKVRGFRVEPAEVEAALMSDPAIKEAAVVSRGESGEGRLVAYVVPARPPGPSIEALWRLVRARLPAHMVPSAIVRLEAMPLTAGGKVARHALPAPGRSRPPLEEAFVGPRTPVEERLAGIWAEALALDAVGIHDRFLDLGGTSLDATRIAARVQTELGTDVSASALLAAPTVAAMALVVVDALAAASPEILERFLAEPDGPGAAKPA